LVTVATPKDPKGTEDSLVWITPDEYKQRDEYFAREAASLQTYGKKAYTIPEGASNALGALGYIRAIEELVNDITNTLGGGNQRCTVINAAGSGGTSAGLILGAKIFTKVVSYLNAIPNLLAMMLSCPTLDGSFVWPRTSSAVSNFEIRSLGFVCARPPTFPSDESCAVTYVIRSWEKKLE
jgi:hypothetical protein